jgi:beta-glucanase (GH16 family)
MNSAISRRSLLGMTATAAATAALAACGSPAPRPHLRPPVPSPAPLPVKGIYTFEDDFDGPAGSPPDPAKWSYLTGNGAIDSGNNESETYTSSAQNAYLDGSSHLVLAVTSPAPGVFNSARIDTKSTFSQLYGSWQARIAVQNTLGCWPAFWFMGKNGRWPACGEIDVMENYGTGKTTGTIWSSTAASQRHVVSSPFVDADFHLYQLDYAKDQIALYRDGHRFLTASPDDLQPWPFNDNGGIYAILNIATGGTGTGYVNPSPAVLPARMIVDFVRAWRN